MNAFSSIFSRFFGRSSALAPLHMEHTPTPPAPLPPPLRISAELLGRAEAAIADLHVPREMLVDGVKLALDYDTVVEYDASLGWGQYNRNYAFPRNWLRPRSCRKDEFPMLFYLNCGDGGCFYIYHYARRTHMWWNEREELAYTPEPLLPITKLIEAGDLAAERKASRAARIAARPVSAPTEWTPPATTTSSTATRPSSTPDYTKRSETMASSGDMGSLYSSDKVVTDWVCFSLEGPYAYMSPAFSESVTVRKVGITDCRCFSNKERRPISMISLPAFKKMGEIVLGATVMIPPGKSIWVAIVTTGTGPAGIALSDEAVADCVKEVGKLRSKNGNRMADWLSRQEEVKSEFAFPIAAPAPKLPVPPKGGTSDGGPHQQTPAPPPPASMGGLGG